MLFEGLRGPWPEKAARQPESRYVLLRMAVFNLRGSNRLLSLPAKMRSKVVFPRLLNCQGFCFDVSVPPTQMICKHVTKPFNRTGQFVFARQTNKNGSNNCATSHWADKILEIHLLFGYVISLFVLFQMEFSIV